MLPPLQSSVSDTFIIIPVVGIKSYESFQYYCLESKEKNGVGRSPGQTEHVLNTILSPVIKKAVSDAVNDYTSLIMGAPEE